MAGTIKWLIPMLIIIGSAGNCPAELGDAKSQSAEKEEATEARLGIGVTSLPEVLSSHLPEVVENGRGVLVSKVMKDSAADRAGLRKHDILLRYGDQDLYAPEQLVKRVRNDEPGKEIEIQYVRAGKVSTTKVSLGEQKVQKPVYGNWSTFTKRFDLPWSPLRPEFWTEADDKEGEGTEWTSFESLTLEKQPDGSYLVRIVYKDTNGNSIGKEFKGTRQEIRDAINNENDLPESRKEQLLRALDDRGRISISDLPWEGWNRELFSWPNVDF